MCMPLHTHIHAHTHTHSSFCTISIRHELTQLCNINLNTNAICGDHHFMNNPIMQHTTAGACAAEVVAIIRKYQHLCLHRLWADPQGWRSRVMLQADDVGLPYLWPSLIKGLTAILNVEWNIDQGQTAILNRVWNTDQGQTAILAIVWSTDQSQTNCVKWRSRSDCHSEHSVKHFSRSDCYSGHCDSVKH